MLCRLPRPRISGNPPRSQPILGLRHVATQEPVVLQGSLQRYAHGLVWPEPGRFSELVPYIILVVPDVLGLQGPISHAEPTEPSSSTRGRAPPTIASRPTLVRGAKDAPQGPRSAPPRRPLRQPNDATTRACERHARSIRGGPRRAVQIVPAPWARPPSSSVAEKMCLPSFRHWPDQVFDALDLIAQPPSLRSGRRGTHALDLIAQPPSLRSGDPCAPPP